MKQPFFALAAIFALCAWGADVAGTWKGSIETPNGTMENTFVFKVDGSKLTGTVESGPMGQSDIAEGKVDGDKLSFVVVRNFNGNEFRMNYKGTVSGDEIKLTIELPAMDRTFELTLKKAS
jgi:hypothetical protein